jgi:hypothetical protein
MALPAVLYLQEAVGKDSRNCTRGGSMISCAGATTTAVTGLKG